MPFDRCKGLPGFLGLEAVFGRATELFLDADELVVLSHTVGAAHRTGLNLAGVGSHGNVGNGGILGFARAVRGYSVVAGTVSHFYGFEGFGKRTYLVHLDKNSVGSAHVDTLLEELSVGYKEVVAHELAAVTDALGEFYPVVPVVLVETVLDRVDRIFGDELLKVVYLLIGSKFATIFLSLGIPFFSWR